MTPNSSLNSNHKCSLYSSYVSVMWCMIVNQVVCKVKELTFLLEKGNSKMSKRRNQHLSKTGRKYYEGNKYLRGELVSERLFNSKWQRPFKTVD